MVSVPELMMIHDTKHDLTLLCELFWPLLAHEKSNPDVEKLTSGMEFDSIVFYLKVKGMNSRDIQNDLVARPSTMVLGYSAVVSWLPEAQMDQFSETAVDFSEDAEVDEIDEVILSASAIWLSA
jgi:hypothetical protein